MRRQEMIDAYHAARDVFQAQREEHTKGHSTDIREYHWDHEAPRMADFNKAGGFGYQDREPGVCSHGFKDCSDRSHTEQPSGWD